MTLPAMPLPTAARLDVFGRVCTLAMRSGRRLTTAEVNAAIGLVAAGATDPEAVLADMRGGVAKAA